MHVSDQSVHLKQSLTMQAARCPTDELSLTNCAVVSEKDLQSGHIKYESLIRDQLSSVSTDM
ncbi:hypothetical protein PAMP_009801 [Pampus punctatissimus]